ncbi:hypothetical protein Tco_0855104 [Tanacetum coccineum]
MIVSYSDKANVLSDALCRKEIVKLRRVRGMILAAQSEAYKQENVLAERLHGLDQQIERKGDESVFGWMIYLVVLVDATESIRDAIGFEYCLASPRGWTNVLRFHSSIQYALFEALYGRKCRSHVLWAEIWESSLIGHEFVQETTDKVVLIKEKFKSVRDRQRSYAGNRRKLAPRYVEPFEILKRIGSIAYRLKLPEELSSTLRFVEEPVEIMDREVKRLKCSRIPFVKVRWNSKRGPEFTWEREDYMKSKYP